MAVPDAPTEGTGAKVVFLVWDNGGTPDTAFFRGVGTEVIDGLRVGHLAVATHADGETFNASDQIVATGGFDTVGGVVRKQLVDTSGRLIGRPMLVYNSAGNNAFAHPRSIAESALNGEPTAAMAVGTHAQATAVAASDPVAVIAGVSASNAKALAADTSGRLLTAQPFTLAGFGHTNMATTGTAVKLRSGTTVCRRARVKADPGNVGTIYLGMVGVTNTEDPTTGGYQLSPGQEVLLDGDPLDLTNLYINGLGTPSLDGVSLIWWT